MYFQASGGIYEDLGDDRLQFGGGSGPTSGQNGGGTNVATSGAGQVITITNNHSSAGLNNKNENNLFYSTTSIQGNYSITPANTLIVQQKHSTAPKMYSI